MIKCWFCNSNVDIANDDFGDHLCPECGVILSVYNPAQPDWKPEIKPKTTQEEWLENRDKKEEKVIIQSSMSPFFKKGDLEEGTVGVIKSIFEPSGQYGNPTGEVSFDNGKVFKVSLNKTSLYDVVNSYGGDTKEWIGKKIVHSIEDIENKKTNALYRGVCIWRSVK